MRNFLLLAAALVRLGVAAARADVAATQYIGHGIAPVEAPDIRMVSAKVDIDWGEPGKLSAVFVMNNEETKAADVQLGFPVSLPTTFRQKGGLDFTMTFDGVPIDRADIRQATPAKDSDGVPADTIWFHCRHSFPPGATTVKVETKLPATQAYHSPYRQDLNYCVQTGAGWKGKIGSEEIAIHFPGPIQPGEIEECRPVPATVEGNTIRWRFENFEPRKGDHDIYLRFLEPDVLPILADLRRESAADPENRRKKLALIEHLLALYTARYSLPLPSFEMSKDELRKILAMLGSDEARTRFSQLYARWLDGCRRGLNIKGNAGDDYPGRQQDEDEITTMLSAVNYVPPHDHSVFLAEGRSRLTQYLQEHPHDADAWNLYLLQSIEFPGTGSIYPYQLDQIKSALQHCPDDPSLRLWNTICQWGRQQEIVQNPPSTAGGSPSPAEMRMFDKEHQLLSQLEKRGILDQHGGFVVRYRSRDGDY